MIYSFNLFKEHRNLFVAFSQKSDRSMKIAENTALPKITSRNRKNYFAKNNINPEKVVSAEIVHSSEAVIVSKNDAGRTINSTDGLLTKEKGIFLSITSADCLPIFLFESKQEIVGMIHAGWKSLAENILSNAIGKIKKLGGSPENTLAGIGPSICQKHYEVGLEIAQKFSEYSFAILEEKNKIFLDLRKVAKSQFSKLGIPKKNIEISSECTFELPEKYFSARRDKPREIEAMIALIGIKE